MNVEKRELLFQDLFAGREFRPFVFPVTGDFVEKFLEVIQDKHPFYSRKETIKPSASLGRIAPQSIAGIYSRLSYLQDHRMPFGAVLIAQDYEFYHFVRIGDILISKAKVIESYQKEHRKFVTIKVTTHNQKDEKISLVRLFIRWPK
jgi:hypothetical protein